MAGKGFGPLGKMKELADAFKKAQEVQAGAQQLQNELEQMEIEGKSEDGLVTVVMSGNQEPRRVEISSDAMNNGAEALSASVTAAMTSAYEQSTELMRGRMEELTSGLNLPGM